MAASGRRLELHAPLGVGVSDVPAAPRGGLAVQRAAWGRSADRAAPALPPVAHAEIGQVRAQGRARENHGVRSTAGMFFARLLALHSPGREGGVEVITAGSGLGIVASLNGLPVLLRDLFVTPALAQGIPSPAPLPSGTPPADGGSGDLITVGVFVAVLGVFVAVLVILDAIVKGHGVRRRREEQGLTLQAWLGASLLMDPLLRSAAVIPTVRVTMRKGSPVKVEVMGSVRSPDMRERAIHIVRQEARWFAPYTRDLEVEDRLSVLSSIAARRAA
jgi:hypothetical protein